MKHFLTQYLIKQVSMSNFISQYSKEFVFLSSILARDDVLNLSIYLQLATYCVYSVIADIGKKRRGGNYKNMSVSRTKGAFW